MPQFPPHLFLFLSCLAGMEAAISTGICCVCTTPGRRLASHCSCANVQWSPCAFVTYFSLYLKKTLKKKVILYNSFLLKCHFILFFFSKCVLAIQNSWNLTLHVTVSIINSCSSPCFPDRLTSCWDVLAGWCESLWVTRTLPLLHPKEQLAEMPYFHGQKWLIHYPMYCYVLLICRYPDFS